MHAGWPANARLFRGLGRAVLGAAADYLERNAHLLREDATSASGRAA
jgi:hypothetical protein